MSYFTIAGVNKPRVALEGVVSVNSFLDVQMGLDALDPSAPRTTSEAINA